MEENNQDEGQRKKQGRTLNFLIHPQFQLTLLAINGLTLLLVTGAIFLQVSRFFDKMNKIGLEAKFWETHPYFEMLKMQSQDIHTSLLIGIGISAIVSTLAILVVSHKLVGPIVRLKSYFTYVKQMRHMNKPFHSLKFRDGDYFTELPEIINEALETNTESHQEDIAA